MSTPRLSSSIKKKLDRSVITKKKLNFAGQKCLEESKAKSENNSEDVNLESLSDDQLHEKYESLKKRLEVLEKHKKEKEELLDYTEKWKEAGNQGLTELTELLKMDREILLKRLGLDENDFD